MLSRPNVAVNPGSYVQDGIKGIWSIGQLSLDKPAHLTGRVQIPREFLNLIKETQLTCKVHFQVIGLKSSGTFVEKLMLKGVPYTPYKGARNIFRSGKFEVRMN